ncbi:MAG: c-type cytochrome [Epsilonproteobacteria bacterium]|nr:c-type cytochrome [Campylobacterota bacterium]
MFKLEGLKRLTLPTLLIVATSLYGSNEAVKKRNYQVADPNHYPYHGITKDKKGRLINVDGAIIRPSREGDIINHNYGPKNKKFNLGKKASKEIIDAWNVDVRPDGKGLPPGGMTVEEGAEVFIKNCAMCHGEFGEGVGKNPVLVGGFGTLTHQAKTGGDPGPEKTIGSYAPYIAPFFWYIKMAMPLPTPKKLTNDEVYGIIGYILQLNEIKVDGKDIEDDTFIDAKFLKKVHMPNEKGFEYNNLRVPDTHNTRCMKNCLDMKKYKIMHMVIDSTDSIQPSIYLPRYSCDDNKKKANNKTDRIVAAYKSSCAACHDSGAASAPVVGNKGDWADRIKQGKKVLYEHAIKGFNGMPPKGGNMSLSDEEVRAIVDYMISKSK